MKIKLIVSWLLVITWMGVIYMFSSDDINKSNTTSKDIIISVTEVTEKVTNIDINNERVAKKLNVPVRKMAHMSEYFILCLLLINAFKVSGITSNKKLLFVLLICFIYACLDEYHQTFVGGRSGIFTDTLIDTSGSVIAFLIYMFFYKMCNKKNIKCNE